MAKETFYFSHDYNARNDKKAKALIKKYGATGYGLYWILAEMLHEDENSSIELDEIQYDLLSDESKLEIDVVKDIINDCVNNYKLFYLDGILLKNNRVERNKDKRTEIKKVRSEAGKEGAKKRWGDSKQIANANSKIANDSKEKESKVKEIKESKDLGTNVPVKTGVLPLANDAELRSLYKEVDASDISAVTKFINEHKPLFAEPYCALWNLFAHKYGFSQISKVNDTRRKKLRTRLSDKDFYLPSILGKAKTAEGLRNGQWFTFDWLIANENNYVKLMEGKYDKAIGNASANQPTGEISKATLEMLNGK